MIRGYEPPTLADENRSACAETLVIPVAADEKKTAYAGMPLFKAVAAS
jgi:hypothetical protein